MSEITVEAVVLRRRDSGESDRRLTLFTRELGKLDVVAKGARKPTSRLAGSSDPLTVARFTFATGKRNSYITQAQPGSGFLAFRQDFDRLQIALAFLELAEAVLPWEQPDEDTYLILMDALGALNSHPKPQVAFLWAQLRLLDVTGFLPRFLECAVSGVTLGEARAWFSPAAGGYVSPAAALEFGDRELVPAEVLIGLGKLSERAEPPAGFRMTFESARLLFRVWRHVIEAPLKANESFLASLQASESG